MNTNIPLSARGIQLDNPLDNYGKALSLQDMIQQREFRDQQMSEMVRKQKYEVDRRNFFKKASDETMQYMQNILQKERLAQEGANAAPVNPGGADVGAAPVPTISPQIVSNDPRYHQMMAQRLQEGGYLEDSKAAMEFGRNLEKDRAPKSELGREMQDLGMNRPEQREAMGKMAVWRKVKGDPPAGFAWDPETGEPKPLKEVQEFILQGRKAGAMNLDLKVNTQLPASEEAQKKFIDKASTQYDALRSAPGTLDNIEKAKELVKRAGGYVGTFGEIKKDVVKFFNNNLGTRIKEDQIQSAEELNSRLFFQIMENLKKMDAQPTERQQEALRQALGNVGNDPQALPRILDAFADVIRQKVSDYNADVDSAQKRGVVFPYDPVIKMPEKKQTAPKSDDVNDLIEWYAK